MAGVLVFGDINLDLLARLDAEPGWDLDNLVPELLQQCGGVGANVAVALARWGAKARLVGCVGRDAFGDLALRYLEASGVDTALVQRTHRATTGLIFIPIHPGGQRTIFGSRGANALVERPGEKCLEGMEAVHLVGYDFLSPSGADAAWSLLDEARRRGARVALDVGMEPSRRIGSILMQAARKVDILFVGLQEAMALTGRKDKDAALAAIAECGAREIVVKLGENGAAVREGATWREVPAFAVNAVDTTGSGDAFAAAYLRARLHDWSPAEAALLANAAGAAAAIVLGAAESMPSPEAILRVLSTARFNAEWEPVREQVYARLQEDYLSKTPSSTEKRAG